jgi:dTDP-4-dehydrorhamnose 3,5-epimerase
LHVTPTSLPGVLLIHPRIHGDARGRFVETYQQPRYAAQGISDTFVQDNVSCSAKGVLRGLHFQHPRGQAKLAWVMEGEVLDVAVDVRRGSPTFGAFVAVRLSSDDLAQLYIPAGFAHGFCVLSDSAVFAYKCSDVYRPECERTIRYDDPDIGITWPIAVPSVSEKDASAPRLAALGEVKLPAFAFA